MATEDKDGNPIRNSAHEPVSHSRLIKDTNKTEITLKQWVPSDDTTAIGTFINKINDDVLWGFAANTIKLHDWDWEEHISAENATHFRRILIFRHNPDTWNPTVPDQGTKVVDANVVPGTGGTGDPTKTIVYKDRNGENTNIPLDGSGNAATSSVQTNIDPDGSGDGNVKLYPTVDFSQLGLPAALPRQ